jgi:hypothetical protein
MLETKDDAIRNEFPLEFSILLTAKTRKRILARMLPRKAISRGSGSTRAFKDVELYVQIIRGWDFCLIANLGYDSHAVVSASIDTQLVA